MNDKIKGGYMKNTFIVNEDFLDNLSKKIYDNFGIQVFNYDKDTTKKIENLPIKFITTDIKYVLQAITNEHIIQIFFDIFKYDKTGEETCTGIDLNIKNKIENKKYVLRMAYGLYMDNNFDKEEVIKYLIEIIQLYIDAVIEEKEEKQEEFKEKFYMEEK